MKKAALFLFILCTVAAGCGGIKTAATGLENKSFLVFTGTPGDYSGGVEVTVDGSNSFTAQVHKDLPGKIKGEVYAISTGTYTVSVSYKGNLLVEKQIFVSAQETKKIVLP